jgi:hypothetical protein
MIKMGAAGLTWGMFGLSLPTSIFLREAHGMVPVNPFYDAAINIFYSGGPSHIDTWDPKPNSPNGKVFPAINVGVNDIYGNPIQVSNFFQPLVDLVNKSPTSYGIGIFRSMVHGNGNHQQAEQYMNCFWQSPVQANYPSTASAMAYYYTGQGLGIPAVQISGNNGANGNDNKGSRCPTALMVQAGQAGANNPTVQELSLPTGSDAGDYQRRHDITALVDQKIQQTRPDLQVKDATAAWNQAYQITTQGKAAKAFDLTGVTLLPGGPNANKGEISALTLAQQLVLAGIPYVACGIGGNDTHSNNKAGVQMNWGDITATALAQMAQNLVAANKKVLVTMYGDFGRTPNTTANGRDGRDHWPDGFSAAVFSIGQPKFKTNAVGDTGPDGMFQAKSNTLVDPIYPGQLGGFVYQALGFNAGVSPQFDIPTAVRNAPPVDRVMAQGTGKTDAPQLRAAFGLV